LTFFAPMADFTKVNLREVEDAAPTFGMPEGLEARFPKRELGSSIGALSLQRLGPGLRSAFGHRHARQEEHYVILDGSGLMKLDDEEIDVRQWDVVRVAGGTMRAFEAGPEGLEFLAYGAPIADEPDVEMAPDWWGR
jgi:mannose-6-phosphate isomerase-like protein (cupin superfamily)